MQVVGVGSPTTEGHGYHMNVYKKYSRSNKLYLLKDKSEAAERIKDYVTWFRNQPGNDMKTLVSDGGGELRSASARQILDQFGVEHVQSYPPSVHQMNGIAERQNRTISKLART